MNVQSFSYNISITLISNVYLRWWISKNTCKVLKILKM